MSIRTEQYRALQMTRALLRDLLDRSKTPRVPKEVRERAYRALRHYPLLMENGEPVFSRDEFELEEK